MSTLPHKACRPDTLSPQMGAAWGRPVPSPRLPSVGSLASALRRQVRLLPRLIVRQDAISPPVRTPCRSTEA